jgi:RNA polymerase sigma-70 factor (ECF subfamily)
LAQRLLGWNGDIDDVVQDVFLTAWNKAGSFRRESSLWTWLTVITLNQCRSRIRRRTLLRRLPFRLVRRDAHPPADRGAIQEETGKRVREAVTRLATLLGVSKNTLDVRLHRARQKLKATLADLITE